MEKEGCNRVGGGILGPSAADQDEDMVDEADQPQTPLDKVDNALKILVRNATEEFGFIPLDAYQGVFNLPRAKEKHTIAVRSLDCSRLITIVREFSTSRGMSSATAERVIAVSPIDYVPSLDRWKIDFKSARIARKVVESMRSEEDRHLWRAYDLLQRGQEGSALAGLIFETIVHRKFSGSSEDESRPQPIPMRCDKCDPPTFSIDLSSSSPTPGTSLSSFTPLRPHARTVVPVNLADDSLSDVTLDTNKYYTQTTATNSLFDSFTIDHDRDRRTVVISIFQITISPRHGGSADGYHLIRKIMTHVGKLLEETGLDATIKVAYFLVCPEGESQHQWQMPADWNKYTGIYDHRGDAFYIDIPIPVHQQTSFSLF